jgi:hypothetical protein
MGGDSLSVKAWQVSLLATWTLCAVAYTWNFYTGPPHDEEYGKWLFLSLIGTAGPLIYCSIPLVFVILSMDDGRRPRRRWIAIIWAAVIICVAYVKVPAFYSNALLGLSMHWASPEERTNFRVETSVDHFADWLFLALMVLATLLWIEKKLVKRGVLT